MRAVRGAGAKLGISVCCLASMFVASATEPVFAGFTVIKNASSGTEIDLWAALDLVAPEPFGPGSSWTSTAFLNAGAGGRRLDDGFDQQWQDGVITVTMSALFWGGLADPIDTLGQQLVFDDEALDGTIESLPSPPVDGFGTSGTIAISSGGHFVFGDESANRPTAWSLPGLNTPFPGGNVDRVVTFDVSGLNIFFWNGTAYELLGAAGPNAHILALDPGVDEDFQDMLILVQAGTPGPPCTQSGDCDDMNACTTDTCNAFGGCVHTPVVCPPGLVCDPVTGSCGCASDADCNDPAFPRCDVSTGECVACLGPADCDDGVFCNGAETCDALNTCQPGTTGPCTDPLLPICDEPDDECVECLLNVHCVDPNRPFCSVGPDVCVECFTNADCDDGLFCNGIETCDPTGTCQSGVGPCTDPLLPICDEPDNECVECLLDVHCVVDPDRPFCSVGPDVCVECLTNADCDDGLFCNGIETCDPTGTCLPGSNPCTDPLLPFCDDATDACVECQTNADCDDGIFCNGVETCDALNTCQSGTGPCTDPLLPICDEPDTECVECLLDVHCLNDPTRPFCSVGPDVCVECLTAADCDDQDSCSTDVCDAGVCTNATNTLVPTVETAGFRSIAVTPQVGAGAPVPVALKLTSPQFPCLIKYIDIDGSLVGAPVCQLPADWGTVIVTGSEIIPSAVGNPTEYTVQADCSGAVCGGGTLTAPGITVMNLWGDVNEDGFVSADDVNCILDAIGGLPSPCTFENMNITPCDPDAFLSGDDVNTVLDAIAGFSFPCGIPCGGGACCVAQVCSLMIPEDCAAAAGTFFGPSAFCFPGFCP